MIMLQRQTHLVYQHICSGCYRDLGTKNLNLSKTPLTYLNYELQQQRSGRAFKLVGGDECLLRHEAIVMLGNYGNSHLPKSTSAPPPSPLLF